MVRVALYPAKINITPNRVRAAVENEFWWNIYKYLKERKIKMSVSSYGKMLNIKPKDALFMAKTLFFAGLVNKVDLEQKKYLKASEWNEERLLIYQYCIDNNNRYNPEKFPKYFVEAQNILRRIKRNKIANKGGFRI